MTRETKGKETCTNAKAVPDATPKGILVPLKTTLETRARGSLLDVYVTSVPVKQASGALEVIRRLLPGDGGVDLQHLRRFAKARDVPDAVREAFERARVEVLGATELLLIVGSTNAISSAVVAEELSVIVNDAVIFSIQVPRLAPTSQEQATLWSSQYWPTVYKKSNPFGPHPSIVSRTEQEIHGEVGKWMDLASEVARQADGTGSGETVGVVIVERKNGIGHPVAVAGDARWVGWPSKGAGNVTAHAALRAIAMVADGVKATSESAQTFNAVSASVTQPEFKADPADQDHFDLSGTVAGYLCHDLEIYCTHEPCVMCSMAILHSRFGKVIFQYRMPKTGGMCADGDLGHGLFWRKELNWTLLAWQWIRSSNGQSFELADFHA
ncbi:cytidine deaminase-like protein [Hyaloscypha bicolor E]|uniref:Cytidine deaminase-like protein n=1 Tax=Hyaloscypha bicolor E TaxID=1095630 RepID=A0A2J6T040_9HELO|nr:cytidine deaminase-like protein [Hyaloscypha bicolor E]PMD56372.1 cytidine deaminase-like protein [Hyaloscypha bicolor E]